MCSQLAPFPQAQGAPGGVPRPAGKVVGLTPEIESFLKRVTQTYAQAASYRDRGRVRLVQQTGRVKTTTETPMEFTFARPNRLRLDAGQYLIVTDGRLLRSIAPQLGQYTEAPAPEKLERKHLVAGSVLGSADEGHPELLDFFLQPDAATRLLAQVVSIGWQPDAEVDGAHCRVLAYETAQRTRVTTFIDAERLVLMKVEAATLPDPAGADAAHPAIQLLYEFSPVELGPKLEPSTFTYQPSPGLKRVNQLGPTSTAEEAAASSAAGRPQAPPILGKAAPALDGKDLRGQRLDPADVRGRTVLLFFWSLAGGQYCLNSIPVMQQVAERFAGRPEFVLLGINADPENAKTVGQMMERKKASFRTILDEEMKLHRAFELEGVPSFVLIGADGQVKWALLGAPPTLQDEVAGEIEKLLGARGK